MDKLNIFILLCIIHLCFGDDSNYLDQNEHSTKSRIEQDISPSQYLNVDKKVLDHGLEEHDLPPAQFTWGGLYPHESTTRERKTLDGVWNFRLSPTDNPNEGFNMSWFSAPLSTTGPVIPMPVPSSYNDVTQDKEIREHVGWAWYDRSFYVPARWVQDKLRILIRFGSCHYNCIIYVNGKVVTSHFGGHLPILADVTSFVTSDSKNLLTVAVNNTLTPVTIPQGSIVHHNDISRYPLGYFEQKYNFDFFNYAGIHRPVYLYSTSSVYIEDVKILTDVLEVDDNTYTGIINYNVSYNTPNGVGKDPTACSVKLLDANDNHVVSTTGCSGNITVNNASLWWPYLMHPNAGYQYTLLLHLASSSGLSDIYPVKVGLRTLGWNNTNLTINHRPLYIRGCGKHEDSDIRGKGYDPAIVVKDFNLLKWLGANAFRTSHYPYAEEIMDMADAHGIMVIDESPAVGLSGFGSELEANHISVMKEYIARDKNRPSVIMWSVGNEPKSYETAAKEYFRSVVNATKVADPSRPVTCVLSVSVLTDLAAAALDVIWVNRYFSWYSDTGHLELIHRQTVTEFTEWHKLYNKPVGISEYGAGSMPGLHMSPSFTWSEEYQTELLLNNFPAFDELRSKGFFVGEMIWNFADFMTPQGYTRVGGNKKGIFTRDRQPKSAAWILRHRYLTLSTNENCHKEECASDVTNVNAKCIGGSQSGPAMYAAMLHQFGSSNTRH